MTCEQMREWFLHADDPAGHLTAAPEVSQHVGDCAACKSLVHDIKRLEQRWRDLPLPAQASTAKAAFLDRLRQPPAPVVQKPKSRRFAAIRYWAAAAMLFIIVGAGFLFFGPGQRVEAHPDVIDELIDWNLDLSQASQDQRQQIYSERRESLQKSLNKAKLDQFDQDLAQDLLSNGSRLANNDDPFEELDWFNKMADRLLERVKTSSDSDAVKADRFAKQFRKVSERGIDPSMERVRAAAAADPERRKLINRILKHDKDRATQINEILERSPDITKKELRQALDSTQKRHKHKKE